MTSATCPTSPPGGWAAASSAPATSFSPNGRTSSSPGHPATRPTPFGHKGQIYDGWETRRRREPGDDFALIRLGLPGVVSGVVVDTAFFKGNFPPEISVEGCAAEGYPSPGELAAADWMPLVPRTAA